MATFEKIFFTLTFTCIFITLQACNQPVKQSNYTDMEPVSGQKTDTAYLAAGCFWCIEAIFQQLDGVVSVASGYTGGTVKNPTYKEVCTGMTGHAEAARIIYNPAVITFDELLEVFWKTHDPTTLNRQGADVGTQYRSGIYFISEEQKEKAFYYKQKLEEEKAFDNPIVTEILPFDGVFYMAEDYHQNYYNQNGDQGYCSMVIRPKVEKFQKVFKDKLKK
jgi:peptide-methionine (S)-S-oxide reductase